MIARVWRGWTRQEDSDAYVEYLQRPVCGTTGARLATKPPTSSGAQWVNVLSSSPFRCGLRSKRSAHSSELT
jgi:hypothetical protein